jgi:dimethylaniline monooxygenase (N-oxide forming)
MGGIWSPSIHRVFNTGKRKCWDGAREAIERVNERVAMMREEAKKKAV